jgi:hypothetical protein
MWRMRHSSHQSYPDSGGLLRVPSQDLSTQGMVDLKVRIHILLPISNMQAVGAANSEGHRAWVCFPLPVVSRNAARRSGCVCQNSGLAVNEAVAGLQTSKNNRCTFHSRHVRSTVLCRISPFAINFMALGRLRDHLARSFGFRTPDRFSGLFSVYLAECGGSPHSCAPLSFRTRCLK